MRDELSNAAPRSAARPKAFSFDGWSFVPIEEIVQPADAAPSEAGEPAKDVHAEAA